MKKKLSLALTLAAALMGARAASATTYADYLLQGNSCVSTTPGNTGIYTQWGPYNGSTTAAMNVTCPLTLPNKSYIYAYLFVEGFNRNSADKLSCKINATGWDGYNYSGNTATLSTNSPSYQIATTTISPSGGYGNLYVNCHIPPATGNGGSFLSTVYLQVGY
jgi:hypothetical protein